MDISDLTAQEQEALRRCAAYAIEVWDWESPILFGVSRDEAMAVVSQWPSSLTRYGASVVIATVWNPMGYYLYGMPLTDDLFVKHFGLSRAACDKLMEKIRKRVDDAILHQRHSA